MPRKSTNRVTNKPTARTRAKADDSNKRATIKLPPRPKSAPAYRPSTDNPGKRGRLDKCLICEWTGHDPDIWGPGRIQQWATPQHDLCTRDTCISEYNRRARAGLL